MNAKRSRLSSDSTPQPPFKSQRTMSALHIDHSRMVSPRISRSSGNEQDEGGREFVVEDDIANLRLGKATLGHWVGPMDPALFLDGFLPKVYGIGARPGLGAQPFVDFLDSSNESEKYGVFISALSAFCPGLKLVNNLSASDTLWGLIAADTSRAYPVPFDKGPRLTDSAFSEIEIPLIFKHNDDDDPFTDYGQSPEDTENRYPFERDEDSHRAIRGQAGSCLSAVAGSQFRLHVFSILICGQWARLLRWDRNGVIVTKKFMYAEEDHLLEFLWRYSHTPANNSVRGHDSTVKPLPSENCAQTSEEIAARIVLEEANRANHQEFRIMAIPDRDTYKEYRFLISYPLECNRHSPFGRTTRPMLAFDLDKNVTVFVKDYWRCADSDAEKEGDIYQLLHDAAVPHIAPFGKGNDVRDHITLTDIMKVEGWALPSAQMTPLRHYRMSLEAIGKPSNKFKSSHELVTAVADAMEAHEVAFYDANILHRDISAGNILITNEGRGMLIDWDMCINLNTLKGKARKPGRTGTWQFLSALLLMDPQHVHDVLDDKESSLYVVLWNMIGYTPHNMTHVMKQEMALFDHSSELACAALKESFLRKKCKKIMFTGRPHLDGLIREISATFRVRYDDPIDSNRRIFLESEQGVTLFPNSYVLRERKLAQRSWVVNTMRKHLQPRSEWPEADKAQKNLDA